MKVTTKKVLKRMGGQFIGILLFFAIIAGFVAGVIFYQKTTLSIFVGMVLISLIVVWYCTVADEIEREEKEKN